MNAGSSVHGILQARIPEWVLISFSRRSSQPRVWTWISCIGGRFFTIWATREGNPSVTKSLKKHRSLGSTPPSSDSIGLRTSGFLKATQVSPRTQSRVFQNFMNHPGIFFFYPLKWFIYLINGLQPAVWKTLHYTVLPVTQNQPDQVREEEQSILVCERCEGVRGQGGGVRGSRKGILDLTQLPSPPTSWIHGEQSAVFT